MARKFVLTTGSTVQCGAAPGHQGAIGPLASQSKLRVGTAPVLVAGDVVGKATATCQNPVPPPSNRCTTVATIAPTSLARKLTIGGSPVLIEPLTGTMASGAPPGTLAATAAQNKLCIEE